MDPEPVLPKWASLSAPLPLAIAGLPRVGQGCMRGSGPLDPWDRSRLVIAHSPINHPGGRRVGIL